MKRYDYICKLCLKEKLCILENAENNYTHTHTHTHTHIYIYIYIYLCICLCEQM